MKKLLGLFTLVMVLFLVTSASAIDQSGKLAIGGYGGYAFGFGDYFKEWDFGQLGSFQNKPTYFFGAKAKFGLTPNIALVGAAEYQAGEAKVELNLGELGSYSESEDWNWIAVLGNLVFVMSPDAKTTPYITAGGGYYIPDEGDSKPGVNAGLGVEHFFQDNLALDAGARFHMIFLEAGEDFEGDYDNATYVQAYLGLILYLGAK